MAADPTRRAILAAAGLPLLLTACRGVQVLGSPPPPPAEVQTLRAAIAAEEQLVSSYAAASQPGHGTARQAAVLTAVLAEHRQHLAQLKSRLIESAAQRSAAAAMVHRSATGPAIPDMAQLEQAEAAASDRLIGQLAGLPASLAQLFASIAASEATHVPLLRSTEPDT
ncbi:MAG: hypothetical protein ACLQFR_03250 [Streptosporangiaceae bacterium]